MNFLKQSMGMGGAVRQGGALPPQLMGAIQDIKRMQAVCGGNMQAMINQVAAQRPEIGQALKARYRRKRLYAGVTSLILTFDARRAII